MTDTFKAQVLSAELVDIVAPAYVRLRLKLDDPADVPRLRAPVGFKTIQGQADDGTTITYVGLVEIEDEAEGIVVGRFNVKRP
jgi:hypothetical protein